MYTGSVTQMTENTEMDGLVEDIRARCLDYAEKKGYQLNPDTKHLETVLKGLARLKIKYGEEYCPCRVRSGDKEKDKANICPCVYHEEEIKTDGCCHCQLFFKK